MKAVWNHICNHREWYFILPFANVLLYSVLVLIKFITNSPPVDDAGALWGGVQNFFLLSLAFTLTGFAKGYLILDLPNDSKVDWKLHLIELIGTLFILSLTTSLIFSLFR